MRRLILVLATIGVAVLLASGAALGITLGLPDDKPPYRYPYVGALVDDEGVYCSGTLISPTVFLTAAHCYPLEGNTSYVTFDPTYEAEGKNFADVGVGVAEYKGTFYADDTYDIAVVKFDANSTPPSNELAELPTLGKLADTAKGAKFTPVGYGDTSGYSDDAGVRRYAPYTTFKSLSRKYLSTSQHRGSGGTCNGDSGGPNFFGAAEDHSNVIAGITITGDTYCKSTNVTLRLDINATRDFLRPYGVLPDPDA